MKKENHHYSGDGSRPFWKRVKRLQGVDADVVYALGCVLQNVEETVIRALENAEANLKPKKASR